MKKRIILLILMFSSLMLSARPQFFVGGGAEWGDIHPTEKMLSEIRENKRYYVSGSRDFKYLSFLIPKISLAVIPYTGFPVGVTFDAGYGFVTGVNSGTTTYNYSYDHSRDYYRYGSDEVLLVSGGITYIHLADSKKYFSVCGSLKYNWNRYTLSKEVIEKGKRGVVRNNTVLDEHSLSAAIGIMGRYDAEYFRIDASLRKDIDYEKGFSSLWDKNGYSFTVSMTLGYVFTILNQHQFMR